MGICWTALNEKIILYNNDCLQVLNTIDHKKKYDLVLTDLPYGELNCDWDTKIDLVKMWEQLEKVCSLSCNYVFFCSSRFGNELINSRPHWYNYDLVWEKYNSVGFLNAKKLPLRRHEMIYIFSNPNKVPRDNRKYNKPLREYSKKCNEYMNIPLSEISDFLGNLGYSHFYGWKALQFSLPKRDNYNKVVEKYNLKQMEGYLTYDEMVNMKETIHIKNKTYNPQMSKGKPYKGNKEVIKENSLYGSKTYYSTGSDTGERYPTSILKFDMDKDKLHPTQKPVALLEYLIKTYSNEGDTVLDICMGSGSTAIACMNTKRKFLGIEKDNDIFYKARDRIFNHERNIFNL